MNALPRVLLAMSCTVSLLTGCPSMPERNPIRYSFEDLGADYSSRSSGQDLDNRTSISITGLSLPIAAGQTVSAPGDRLPDLLAVPITDGCSRLVVTKYPSDATLADVISIKNTLDGLTQASLSIVVAQSKLELLTLAKDRLSQLKDSDTAKPIRLLHNYRRPYLWVALPRMIWTARKVSIPRLCRGILTYLGKNVKWFDPPYTQWKPLKPKSKEPKSKEPKSKEPESKTCVNFEDNILSKQSPK